MTNLNIGYRQIYRESIRVDALAGRKVRGQFPSLPPNSSPLVRSTIPLRLQTVRQSYRDVKRNSMRASKNSTPGKNVYSVMERIIGLPVRHRSLARPQLTPTSVYPLIYHSIPEEIPEASRGLMTRIYYLWLLLVATLAVNLVACVCCKEHSGPHHLLTISDFYPCVRDDRWRQGPRYLNNVLPCHHHPLLPPLVPVRKLAHSQNNA
jgi:hypothetical protein